MFINRELVKYIVVCHYTMEYYAVVKRGRESIKHFADME